MKNISITSIASPFDRILYSDPKFHSICLPFANATSTINPSVIFNIFELTPLLNSKIQKQLMSFEITLSFKYHLCLLHNQTHRDLLPSIVKPVTMTTFV